MKLSAFTVFIKTARFQRFWIFSSPKGIEYAEVGSGGFIGKDHCDPAKLLKDRSAREAFQELFLSREMKISSLSCHGNPGPPAKGPGAQLPPGYPGFDRPGRPAGCRTHRDLLRLPG